MREIAEHLSAIDRMNDLGMELNTVKLTFGIRYGRVRRIA